MVITTAKGVKVDMSEQVQRLLLIANYSDFRYPQNARYIDKLGRRLIVVAGPQAPGDVINGLAGEVPRNFLQHLCEVWSDAFDDLAGDDD